MKKKVLIILCIVLISLIAIISLKTLYDNSYNEGLKLRFFVNKNCDSELLFVEGEHYYLNAEYGFYAKTKRISKTVTKTFAYAFKCSLKSDSHFISVINHMVIPIFQGEYITKSGKTYLINKTNYVMADYSCDYYLYNVDAPNVGDVDYDVNKDIGMVFYNVDVDPYLYGMICIDYPIFKEQIDLGKLDKTASVALDEKDFKVGESILTRIEMTYKHFNNPGVNIESSITKMNYNLKFNLVTENKHKPFASFNKTRCYGLMQLKDDYTIRFYSYSYRNDSSE